MANESAMEILVLKEMGFPESMFHFRFDTHKGSDLV